MRIESEGRFALDPTLFRARRITHLKIVSVAVAAAIVVVAVGSNARIDREGLTAQAKGGVVKAVNPTGYAGQDMPSVR